MFLKLIHSNYIIRQIKYNQLFVYFTYVPEQLIGTKNLFTRLSNSVTWAFSESIKSLIITVRLAICCASKSVEDFERGLVAPDVTSILKSNMIFN